MPHPDPTGPATDAIVVELSDTQRHLAVDPGWVDRVVRLTLAAEGVARAAISVALTDDASIRVINRRHLSHDWATDVISFLLSDPDDEEMVGELVVSAETAVTSANEVASPPLLELALYLVHGLLHLCGWDDRTDDDVAVIRAREAAVLALLGMGDPCPAVVSTPATSDDSGRESMRWPR